MFSIDCISHNVEASNFGVGVLKCFSKRVDSLEGKETCLVVHFLVERWNEEEKCYHKNASSV